MERYVSADQALLWILWNDTNKKLSFLDDKAFPRDTGYTTIWIMREPMMDQVWDASTWSPSHLVQWIQDQERAGFDVEWPQPHPSTSVKTLTAEYTAMGLNPAGLSKDDLRKKVGRAKAIKVLGQL
jgi:hypothetical protein